MVASVVWIGYFVFSSLVYVPVFEHQMQAGDLRDLLEQISNRFRPLFGGALLIFLVTGSCQMLVNRDYRGPGSSQVA